MYDFDVTRGVDKHAGDETKIARSVFVTHDNKHTSPMRWRRPRARNFEIFRRNASLHSTQPFAWGRSKSWMLSSLFISAFDVRAHRHDSLQWRRCDEALYVIAKLLAGKGKQPTAWTDALANSRRKTAAWKNNGRGIDARLMKFRHLRRTGNNEATLSNSKCQRTFTEVEKTVSDT